MNAASTPEFKKILREIYHSGQPRTSGEALEMAWAEYRQKHGGAVTVQQRRYAQRKSFENPGYWNKFKGTYTTIHRKIAGAPFLAGDKVKILEVGGSIKEPRFNIINDKGQGWAYAFDLDLPERFGANPRKKKAKGTCKTCGGIMSGSVCLHCLKSNPIPLFSSKHEAETFRDIFNGAHAETFPYSNVQLSTLGGEARPSLIFTVSFDPKSTWHNGILENSRYLKAHLGHDGTFEMISGNRVERIRKSKVKTPLEVAAKIGRAGKAQSNPKGFKIHPGYKGKVGELRTEFAYKRYLVKFNAIHSIYNISRGGTHIGTAGTETQARAIIDQIADPNENPIAIYNPPGAKPLPMAVIEIRYKRTGGKHSGKFFRHHFKVRPKVFGLPDGSIIIQGSQRLWGTV